MLNKIYKNKRADISVTLTVVLTAILVFYTLFVFASSQDYVQEEAVNVNGFFNEIYSEEDQIKSFVPQIAEQAFVDALAESGGILDSWFIGFFENNFRQRIESSEFFDENSKQLLLENLNLEVVNGKLIVVIEDFVISYETEKLGAQYVFDIVMEFDSKEY